MIKRLMYRLSARARERIEDAFHERKSAWMRTVLGPEHDMVMHAIIPYAVGGPVDVYMYPKRIPGTILATKEMVDWGHQECRAYDGHFYEVAMATRHPIDEQDDSPFGAAMLRCRKMMTMTARYSGSAVLKSGDTVEMPMADGEANACAVFWEVDAARRTVLEGRPITVQYIIEVHRPEMEFARANGTARLIELLRQGGHFPYSDLDRPVCV